MKRVLKPLVFIIGAFPFILFAAAGVALILELKNGWISAISKTIAYPVYCSIILLFWILSAEKFTEGVRLILQFIIN